MDLNTLKALLELGWPGLVTFFFGYLAVTYINDQKDQIQYLRKRIDDLETKIKQVSERMS